MIDNQIYLINCTKTLSVHNVHQAHRIRDLSVLYWRNEQLDLMTWNAPLLLGVFCSSFPQLAQWLVYYLLLTFTTPPPQALSDMGCWPLQTSHSSHTTSIVTHNDQSNRL